MISWWEIYRSSILLRLKWLKTKNTNYIVRIFKGIINKNIKQMLNNYKI
jgi:hypothetical protein